MRHGGLIFFFAISQMLVGCGSQPPPRQAILILLDAARPDRFSAYGYPHATTPRLDAVAADGVIFRNHFAQGTDTRTTLPSLLYSRYYVPPLFPADARVPFAAPEELFRRPDDEAMTLPEVLADAGLRTAMISAHTWLHEDSAFASAFDEAHDLSQRLRSETSTGYPNAARTIDYARAWLDTHRDEDFFLYLHLMDTHFPHVYGADAETFMPSTEVDTTLANAFSANGLPRRRRHLSAAERRYFDALYDGSLHYVDRELGRLFDQIDSWRSEVLIAVTADHGEHLLETSGRVLHGGPWLDAVARIPLILRYRGKLPAGVVDEFTESIDVMPTMLGLLGVSPPASVRPDGADLRASTRGNTSRGNTSLGNTSRSNFVFARGGARDAATKCLFDTPDSQLLAERPVPLPDVRGRLYDLASDPLETIDQWSQKPAAAMRCLDAYRRRMTRPFRRYQSATRTSQPTSPFAISVAYFGIEDLPRAQVERLGRTVGRGDAGWAKLRHKHRTFLASSGDASERLFRLPVPDGRYAVELGHRGRCRVTLEHQDPVIVETRAFDPARPRWHMRTSNLGNVEITQQRVAMRLGPTDDGTLCLVGHLGFTPLDHARRSSAPDAERRERLRALGYLD